MYGRMDGTLGFMVEDDGLVLYGGGYSPDRRRGVVGKLSYFTENEYFVDGGATLCVELSRADCEEWDAFLMLDLGHMTEDKVEGILSDLAALAEKAGVLLEGGTAGGAVETA